MRPGPGPKRGPENAAEEAATNYKHEYDESLPQARRAAVPPGGRVHFHEKAEAEESGDYPQEAAKERSEQSQQATRRLP